MLSRFVENHRLNEKVLYYPGPRSTVRFPYRKGGDVAAPPYCSAQLFGDAAHGIADLGRRYLRR